MANLLRTLTVAELRAALELLPGDAPVAVGPEAGDELVAVRPTLAGRVVLLGDYVVALGR